MAELVGGDPEAAHGERIAVFEVVERFVKVAARAALRRVGLELREVDAPLRRKDAQPPGGTLGPLRLGTEGKARRFEGRNVEQHGCRDHSRQYDPQIASRPAREEEQHAERHHCAARQQPDAHLRESVFTHTPCDTDPEQGDKRQRQIAETVVEPVERPPLEQFAQRLDQQRRNGEAEDQVGHAAVGQPPREENLEQVEVEHGRIGDHSRREDVVEHHLEQSVARGAACKPTVEHHQEEHRNRKKMRHESEPSRKRSDPFGRRKAEDEGRRPENRLEESEGDIREEHRQNGRAQIEHRVGDKPPVLPCPAACEQRQRREHQQRDKPLRRGQPLGKPRPERQRHERRPCDPVDAAPGAVPDQQIDNELHQRTPPQEHHPRTGSLVPSVEDEQRDGQRQQQHQLHRMAAQDGEGPFAERFEPVSEFLLQFHIHYDYGILFGGGREGGIRRNPGQRGGQNPRPHHPPQFSADGTRPPLRRRARCGGHSSPRATRRCAGGPPRRASRQPQPRR